MSGYNRVIRINTPRLDGVYWASQNQKAIYSWYDNKQAKSSALEKFS